MDILSFIKENYTWFFSGLGVFLLTLFFAFFKRKNGNINIIKGKSRGIQAQRDININKR